jgi:microcystin-dependent protein
VPSIACDHATPKETTVPEPFLGEIRMFGFNFPPQGWASCDGQTLPISQNTALFSLLGTTYGGDGTTTFALPDLQSRVAIHPGQGIGLSACTAGQAGGTENVTLLPAQMPTHTHSVHANNSLAEAHRPAGRVLARAGTDIYAAGPDGSTVMDARMLGDAGGNDPHQNIQPYLVLNFCIALQGIFPARS